MNAPVPSWNTVRSVRVHAPTRGQDTSRERGSQMAPRLGHQCHSRKSYESEIAILDLNTVDKQTSNNCKDEHADANGYADEGDYWNWNASRSWKRLPAVSRWPARPPNCRRPRTWRGSMLALPKILTCLHRRGPRDCFATNDRIPRKARRVSTTTTTSKVGRKGLEGCRLAYSQRLILVVMLRWFGCAYSTCRAIGL